jgi:hypothetical protein
MKKIRVLNKIRMEMRKCNLLRSNRNRLLRRRMGRVKKGEKDKQRK